MLIRHYWAKRGVYSFDEATGAVKRESTSVDTPIPVGAIWKQRGCWFALWHNGTTIFFQHRSHRWPLGPDATFSVKGRFKRTFQITSNGKTLFEFRYWFKGIIFAHIDPTYDSLDEESDDFFLYVVGMWRYWKDKDPAELQSHLRDTAQ